MQYIAQSELFDSQEFLEAQEGEEVIVTYNVEFRSPWDTWHTFKGWIKGKLEFDFDGVWRVRSADGNLLAFKTVMVTAAHQNHFWIYITGYALTEEGNKNIINKI